MVGWLGGWVVGWVGGWVLGWSFTPCKNQGFNSIPNQSKVDTLKWKLWPKHNNRLVSYAQVWFANVFFPGKDSAFCSLARKIRSAALPSLR